MTILKKGEPFPAGMQGEWVDSDDPSSVVIIRGADISCLGQAIAYDYLRSIESDGALTVEMCVDDPTREDDFQRANITGLVISPEGEFFAYNTRFTLALQKREAD